MSQYITALRDNKTEAKFKSHYIHKRFFMQFSVNNNDVSAGKNNRKCHSIRFIYVSIVFVLELRLQCDNQLPKYLRYYRILA